MGAFRCPSRMSEDGVIYVLMDIIMINTYFRAFGEEKSDDLLSKRTARVRSKMNCRASIRIRSRDVSIVKMGAVLFSYMISYALCLIRCVTTSAGL